MHARSRHLFLHKCTRGVYLCVPTAQRETMTAGRSHSFHCVYCRSTKTDVHTDMPSLHPSAGEEDSLLPPPPPCLHLNMEPKQKHPDRPNNVSSPRAHNTLILLGAKAHFSSPTVTQQPWVTTRPVGMGWLLRQACVVVIRTGDGICSTLTHASALRASRSQARYWVHHFVMIRDQLLPVTQMKTYIHVTAYVLMYTPLQFRTFQS